MKFLKVIGIILIILLIPIFITILMHIDIFSGALGDANGWLGYWGGYLGALIGAATVYIVTTMQLQTQRKLHEENLKAQIRLNEESIKEQLRLHNSNIEQQRELQSKSIKINDSRERELIIANLRLNKIDSLIQELILINRLNSERFNILRSYNFYNDMKKDCENKIYEERKQRKFMKILESSKKSVISSKYRKFPKNKVNKIKYKNINLEKILVRRKEYFEKREEVMDQETEKRNEIRISSAKIKSEGLYVNQIDDELNSFRVYQTEIIELFYNEVLNDNKSLDEFYSLIDYHDEKFMKKNNAAIHLCVRKLNQELNKLEHNIY
ncbi:hypothetical protein [Peribacillus muralis]|uniref:hypothetical protein n=1 Tax=Peribacillus muralis TaxID=264697 RepID=UPI003D0456A3